MLIISGGQLWDQWMGMFSPHMKRVEASPQFQYWFIVMQLELLVLVYVRYLREANFSLYVAVLVALTPCFFALDHTHYSRWVPIHIRDMMTLHERHPDVASQFAQGGFVVHKTSILSDSYRSCTQTKQQDRERRRWCSRFVTKSKSPIALDGGRA